MDMMEILLGLIRASREGNWMLHVAMIKTEISWMFAYYRLNYAKYLLVHFNQMLKLPMEHPGVYSHLKNGQTHLDLYLLIKQLRRQHTKTHIHQGHLRIKLKPWSS